MLACVCCLGGASLELLQAVLHVGRLEGGLPGRLWHDVLTDQLL